MVAELRHPASSRDAPRPFLRAGASLSRPRQGCAREGSEREPARRSADFPEHRCGSARPRLQPGRPVGTPAPRAAAAAAAAPAATRPAPRSGHAPATTQPPGAAPPANHAFPEPRPLPTRVLPRPRPPRRRNRPGPPLPPATLPAGAAPALCADRLTDGRTEGGLGAGHGPEWSAALGWPPPTARAPAQGAGVRGLGRARARRGPHARPVPQRLLREALPSPRLSRAS
ncbi:unnamed protein product [Nyctereutes procyonoides]|uniref:(raccoon dog) hypothetical protein n=1 Tax=Nyctereutes procyonoides TaxID=34880 RepID=A0A811Z3Q0_NYCPR|nr:unnamed protein product [Nyctereutes procyonoides]